MVIFAGQGPCCEARSLISALSCSAVRLGLDIFIQRIPSSRGAIKPSRNFAYLKSRTGDVPSNLAGRPFPAVCKKGHQPLSGVNSLKLARKIFRPRQVCLSDERVPENFRTFSVGRLVGYA
jgi:hypothetical protein